MTNAELERESPPGDLISVREATGLLPGYSPSTLYRWIRSGRLRAWEIAGTRVMVSRSDVEGLVVQKVPDAPAELPRTQSQAKAAEEEALANLRQKGWPV